MQLTDQTAVVTGGASGIGLATARLLARHGARVFTGDLHPGAAAESVSDAQSGSGRIVQVACDVRIEADVQRLIEQAAAAGRLTILVNNAGVGMVRQITEVTEAEWDLCLDTNLKGAFFGCKHAIRQMQKTGGGSIVNIASNAGLLPRAHDPVYSTSKGALVAFTKSLALCHARDRIRINSVCPGPVGDTRMMNDDLESAPDPAEAARQMISASPLAKAYARMISPDEVAQAVLYLVSESAAMVTGTSIAIDGGKSLGVPPR